jgi:hypothetical protein
MQGENAALLNKRGVLSEMMLVSRGIVFCTVEAMALQWVLIIFSPWQFARP